MPHKPCQRTQRNTHRPQKQDIRHHEKAGIAAAPQHALGHDVVAAHENHDEPHRQHQLTGDFLGLGGHLIHPDDRPAEQHDEPACQHADARAQHKEGDALLLGAFCVALAQRVPDDDAAGLTDALREGGGKLLRHRGDGVGRHKRRADVPHHHRHRIVAKTQQRVADEHRQADAQIFPQQAAAAAEQVLHPIADAFFHKQKAAENDGAFHRPADEGAQRRTGHAHGGRAEFAENKDVVGPHVHKKGGNAGQQRQTGLAHAAQHQRGGQRKAGEPVGGDRPEKIHGAQLQQRGLGGVQGQNGAGHGQRCQRKAGGNDKAEPQHDGDGLLQAGHIALAPEPGGEHRRAHAHAHAADLKQRDELVRQRHRAERLFPQPPHHDGVHHVHAHGNHALQRNGNGDGGAFSVKCPAAHKPRHQRSPSSYSAAWSRPFMWPVG